MASRDVLAKEPQGPSSSDDAERHGSSALVDDHLQSVEDCCQKYGVSVSVTHPQTSSGLAEDDAARRLQVDGPNILSPPKRKPAILVFIGCMLEPFNVLLLIAALFTFVLYGLDRADNGPNLTIGAVLVGFTTLNALVDFYQLQSSAKLLASFMNLIPTACNVIRGGKLKPIPAGDLVCGDVVYMRMGDKVPADLRVFHCSDLKVDNSSLTGESEPQSRSPKNTFANLLEATNIAFNGTLVVSGDGYGIVVRTGDKTVIGQIAGLTNGETKRKSPMTEEIETFVKGFGFVAVLTAIIFFVVLAVRTPHQLGNALTFGIGIMVAWIPLGMPVTVTMLLTIAAKRMAQKNVLVKNLQAVETLGAITMLCTDKTGTLTRNQMTVANMWTQQTLFSADNDSQRLPDGVRPFDSLAPGVNDLLKISALCTRARFDRTDIVGDATEQGLFRLASTKLADADEVPSLRHFMSGAAHTDMPAQMTTTHPKVLELPFNSETKWHLTIHDLPHPTGVYSLYIKGAPERVLRICSTVLDEQGAAVPITDAFRDMFTQTYEHMASQGHRVLAFAKLELDQARFPAGYEFDKEEKNFPTTGLTFVGLVSLEDPPKHGVREAIGHCRRAGIQVVMVTGDHPLTAEAIGRKINLMLHDTKETMAKRLGIDASQVSEDDVKAIVIHGESIDTLTPEDWDLIFSKQEIIFARTSPKHKLQIVKYAQSLGHLVGVTGDGVNDSPALKKADLGIAMNISGSDVSKEAATMILLDDNFASTVNGIREGRLIFMNLKKAIQYVATHTMPEVIPQLLNVLVPMPLTLAALQIMVIDLGFEIIAPLGFAFEPPESEAIMKMQPRRPVNEATIARLRARNAFDLQYKLDAEEAQYAAQRQRRPSVELEAAHPPPHESMDIATQARSTDALQTRPLTWTQRMQQMRNAQYWDYWWNHDRGEVLVDTGVILWAYLEGGGVEVLGAFVTFFVVAYSYKDLHTSPSDLVRCQRAGGFSDLNAPDCTLGNGNVLGAADQLELLAQAQSSYYLSVMIIQMWNLLACKCRIRMPFSLYILRNKITWLSMLLGAGFAVVVVYTAPFNTAFLTSRHLNGLFLLIPFAFGLVLFFYSAIRLYVRRRLNLIQYTPEPLGLQMHPTRWSRK
ncbi:hypothetical protein RI367_008015 [Sorochytrium milnesiophthora]